MSTYLQALSLRSLVSSIENNIFLIVPKVEAPAKFPIKKFRPFS